jgi:succinoglycan biosynthesis protein ExoM
MSTPITKVSIAIITCGRPDGLEKLLIAIRYLELPDFPDISLRVVVVENGRKELAEAQVEFFQQEGMDVGYAHEPRPGISFARNMAMDLALQQGEYIAFIDDDEYPGSLWLNSLLHCALEHGAPLVRGPVLPVLPVNAPHWAIHGGFFMRERYACGTEIPYCASNNVLIQSELLLDSKIRFNPSFALTGGEDTLFFLQLCKMNCIQPIWCDLAVVYEDVNSERLDPTWLKRRARRAGSNMPQYDAILGGVPFFRLRWVLHGLFHLAVALILRLKGMFRSEVSTMRSYQRYSMGVGMIRGAMGQVVQEYADRHEL